MIFGKIKKDKIPEITKIIGEILSYYSKAYKTEDGFDEDLFIAAFCFDEIKAFNIFKPSKLSINGYRKCLQMKP